VGQLLTEFVKFLERASLGSLSQSMLFDFVVQFFYYIVVFKSRCLFCYIYDNA